MSTTRRGFLGSLLAVPFLARLVYAPAPTSAPFVGAAGDADFDAFMRAHEVELQHTEGLLMNTAMPPICQGRTSRELERLATRYCGPFQRQPDQRVTDTHSGYPVFFGWSE